jgi:hypothetical protein
MPVIANPEHNFLYGLSDFWIRLFEDTPILKSVYDAMQVQIGQTYLNLLSDVLGVALDEIPLFSKRYFQSIIIPEYKINYQEGSSPTSDRYAYLLPEIFVSINSLMNKVILPTSILEHNIDYELKNSTLYFKKDIFNPVPDGFAVRTSEVIFPYAYQSLDINNWNLTNVKKGDTFQIQFQRGTYVESTIVYIVGNVLVFNNGTPNLVQESRRYAYDIRIVRKPYDYQKTGFLATNVPIILNNEINVARLTHGSTQYTQLGTVDFTSPDATNNYIYVNDPDHSENNGIYRIRSVISANIVELDRTMSFYNPTFNTINFIMLRYPETTTAQPEIQLPHTDLLKTSVVIQGRNALTRNALLENIDYKINYVQGKIVQLTPWDNLIDVLIAYNWLLLVQHIQVPAPIEWSPGQVYVIGTRATYLSTIGRYYVYCRREHISGTVFKDDLVYWQNIDPPFVANPIYPIREISFWAPDILVDQQKLYANFGYLLDGYPQKSTEAYRLFLQGIMRLFVLGPRLSYLEAALNLIGGLPIVRNNKEILIKYEDGIAQLPDGTRIQGTTGKLINAQMDRRGSFNTSGYFTSPVADFYASDVTAVLTIVRTTNPHNSNNYVIQSVISPTEVLITPFPESDEENTGFIWKYQHTEFNNIFQTNSHTFTDEDINGYIIIRDAINDQNNGSFKILHVVSPTTLVLDTVNGFLDEVDLTWVFTITNTKRITTDQNTYDFPFETPIRPAITLETNYGYLFFNNFDPMTDAFPVVDYIEDPTWWHNNIIPKELLTLNGDELGRRQTSSTVIPHTLYALDGAASGDLGLIVGRDSEHNAPIPRKIGALILDEGRLQLDQPIADSRDVGQYISLGLQEPLLWSINTAYTLADAVKYKGAFFHCIVPHTSGTIFDYGNWSLSQYNIWKGSYKIMDVSLDNMTITLERFPPPGFSPIGDCFILQRDLDLPPFLFRRTVGFVLFDSFLKYHCLFAKINMQSAINTNFIRCLSTILGVAKPSYTYLFVSPAFTVHEHIRGIDSMRLVVGVHFNDSIATLDSDIKSGTELHTGDCYTYRNGTVLGAFNVTPYAFNAGPITPLPGIAPPYRTLWLFGRFNAGNNADGTLITQEGVDYTYNRETGDVIVINPLIGNDFQFDFTVTFLRVVEFPAIDMGEVAIVVGGSDPTIYKNSDEDLGIIDRAITLKIETV